MGNGRLAFGVARRLARAIPDSLPGKTRVARTLLRPFIDGGRSVSLPDRFGNMICLPSCAEPMALHLFASGVYEPGTLRAILSALSQTGVYVDVGANVGILALPVAVQRPGAQVVCIEAHPDIAAVLRRNVADNERPNVMIVECLAGPVADCKVPFYPAPRHKFGMGSIGPQFDAAPMMLRQRTLDDVLDELCIDHVDVVKLDIEGAELGALHGLRRRLTGIKPPTVVFEFNDWAERRIEGQSPGDAQALLLSTGYRLFRLVDDRPPRAIDRPLTEGAAMILALPKTLLPNTVQAGWP